MALSDRPGGVVTQAASVPNQNPLNTQGGQKPALPATQSLVSTAETLIVSNQLSSAALSCALPPDTANEQTVLDMWASGIITTTAAGNITLKVYEGLAIASGNLLGSSGAIAQASKTAAFWAHLRLIYNSVSGALEGDVEFFVNDTPVAKVAFSNVVTGFLNQGNPSANPPTVANLPQFCLSVTSSGAASGTPTTVVVQKFSCG